MERTKTSQKNLQPQPISLYIKFLNKPISILEILPVRNPQEY